MFDHFESLKFDRILSILALYLGHLETETNLTDGYVLLFLVKPPTAHVFGILKIKKPNFRTITLPMCTRTRG